jgi:hypothetical protein
MMQIRLNGYVKVNSDYFIRKGETFEEVKGKKLKFRGYEEFDFFAHKVEKGKMTFWQITEAISGCKVGKMNKSLKKAMDRLDNKLHEKGSSRVEHLIREMVGQKFLSPSYRFVANPNSIYYVATKNNSGEKSVFPRRYKVQIRKQ